MSDDDTLTVVDSAEILGDDIKEDCNCGMKDILNYKKFCIMFEIKVAQTTLDKLLGRLELIEELLDDSKDSEDSNDEN